MTRVLVAPSTRKLQNNKEKKTKTKIYSTNDTDKTTVLERLTHSYTNQADSKEAHIEYIPLKKKSRNQLYDFKNLQYRLIYLQTCARVEWGAMNGAHN